MATLTESLLSNFQALTLAQRIGVVVVMALAIATIPMLMMMGKEPELVVLFSQLNPDDTRSIAQELGKQGAVYEVGEGGNTIKVPAERVHELRLQMASLGLPESAGVGFEIFDRTGLGVTPFTQQMNYRRALQGELARTISQLSQVERVRVHLVIPEKRLFATEQKPAQAAVVLTLKRGTPLGGTQVQGIVHLVASSVEGLEPSQVTVVDNHGQVLSQNSADGDAQLTASQIETQRRVERDLEQRVQTMLDQVLGREKSVVRVTAPLEFRQVEITEESFDPNSQVVRSENRSQEKVVESGAPLGVPGVRTNVPNELKASEGGRPKEAKRKNETLNYEVNRKVSKIIEPTGAIKRLSVAVLVDGTYEAAQGAEGQTEGNSSEKKYVARPEQEIQNLVQIVKKAVGFSEERGDQIEVINVAFESPTILDGEDGVTAGVQSFLAAWGGFLKPVLFFILGVLVLWFVVRPMALNLSKPAAEPVLLPQKGLPATVTEYEAHISETPQEQAIKLAADNPASAAQVIRTWIKEEQAEKV
ncbi:MAG: flagellar basal-body MS-ring/collar protein FliF [Nitrospirota bacterium]|nr:flagellar basal-body MS-ring/collar protein FliF [Nitrospirota bacterium]MDH4361251.1 flagellar basal-body MS-ring/collar protein FliF [Nitrospirota bacterium]MDH5574404.1 flagellar basal-body MS-ring/collar protein FliF [Nitrospirota bacterium]